MSEGESEIKQGTLDEVGREILWPDLKLRTVVWIKPPDEQNRGMMFSFWVRAFDDKSVAFYSRIRNWAVINRRGPEDTFIDDRNRRVHVYEYLGEI